MENETRVAENEVWLSRWTVDRFSKKETEMSKIGPGTSQNSVWIFSRR